MPVISPLRSGKYSQPQTSGTKYAVPHPKPFTKQYNEKNGPSDFVNELKKTPAKAMLQLIKMISLTFTRNLFVK